MNVQDARKHLASLVPDPPRPGQVTLSFDDRVAHLVVDNPSARGAITLSMMRDLADAVIALQTFAGSLVVLSSTDPRAFCSGGHLGEVSDTIDGKEAALGMSRAMTAVLDGLLALPVPSIAALDGLALGGGAELAVACDWRVATPNARIHFVHARMGIAPGWGATGRLVRLVGRNHALRLLSSARSVSRGEAMAMGLVDHLCDGSPIDAAVAWCAPLLAQPPTAIRAIKTQVAAAAPPRRTAEGDESIAFSEAWGGPDHQHALEGLQRHRR